MRIPTDLRGSKMLALHIVKLPLNMQLQGFYNVECPDIGTEWSIRFQVRILLPKSIL